MDFGLFLEFSGHENEDEAKVFQRGFDLIDEAESLGIDSVWLPEYHFIPVSVLSSPIAVASSIASRTKKNADRVWGLPSSVGQSHKDC